MTSPSDQTKPPAQPGNDGSWFLDAIGARVAEPSTAEHGEPEPDAGAAALPATAPDEASTARPGQEATQVATATATAVATAGDAPGGSPNGPVTEDPLTDFTPQALDKRLDSSRSWQWPFVIGGLIVGVIVVMGLLWLPRANQSRADDQANEYTDALAAMLNDLSPTQQALAELTDPATAATSLGSLVAPITTFQTDADAAVRVASAPMPSPMPLTSSQPYDELVPLRDAVAAHGTTGDAIARRMNDLLDYRSTFDAFLETGPLPATAEGVDVNELATTLSTASVDGATIISRLPNDAALAEHKAEAQSMLVEFTDDHLGYLDALRTGDQGTAQAFVDAVAEDRSTLDRLMADALRRMRSEIDVELVALSSDIALVLARSNVPA